MWLSLGCEVALWENGCTVNIWEPSQCINFLTRFSIQRKWDGHLRSPCLWGQASWKILEEKKTFGCTGPTLQPVHTHLTLRGFFPDYCVFRGPHPGPDACWPECSRARTAWRCLSWVCTVLWSLCDSRASLPVPSQHPARILSQPRKSSRQERRL